MLLFENKAEHEYYRLSELQKHHAEYKYSRNQENLNSMRYS